MICLGTPQRDEKGSMDLTKLRGRAWEAIFISIAYLSYKYYFVKDACLDEIISKGSKKLKK